MLFLQLCPEASSILQGSRHPWPKSNINHWKPQLGAAVCGELCTHIYNHTVRAYYVHARLNTHKHTHKLTCIHTYTCSHRLTHTHTHTYTCSVTCPCYVAILKENDRNVGTPVHTYIRLFHLILIILSIVVIPPAGRYGGCHQAHDQNLWSSVWVSEELVVSVVIDFSHLCSYQCHLVVSNKSYCIFPSEIALHNLLFHF